MPSARLRAVDRRNRTSLMPPMDDDRTPTEPTTDHEPPNVTSLTPGPSQAPTSRAAGQGGRAVIIGAIVGLALVVTFSAGIGVGRLVTLPGAPVGTASNPASGPGASAPTEFGLIKEAWDTIHEKYVAKDELDDQQLIYGAIEGMTQAVGDTGHTDFMTPEEREERNDALSGSYVGIGVRIDETEDGLPRIVVGLQGQPRRKGRPALGRRDRRSRREDHRRALDRRGRRPGPWRGGHDRRADDPALGRHGTDAVDRPRRRAHRAGDVGRRPGVEDRPHPPRAVLRGRRRRHGAGVEGRPGGRCGPDRPGPPRQPRRLRQRGGRRRQPVPLERHRLHRAERRRRAHGASGLARRRRDRPAVGGLVDGTTASSSEIVSGALQDAERAKVVGETTFGTGTVLGEFTLSDGSALRIGTVEWLTPEGRRIWHEGIAPDVPVTLPDGVVPLTPDDVRDLTPAEVSSMQDAQLARALEIVATEAAQAAP